MAVKKAQKARTLVIVESPSKAKTINKYLGSDYIISSSVGHIIDLPKSRLAIDIENNFRPEYITIRGKAKVLNELKKHAAASTNVLLATDPDREGEAISWHLSNALSSVNDDIRRIEFNEITEEAVKTAVSHPREINMDLVNAQQARRILDRIVGYNISPILWKKVKKGLSAGRVQSVALRIICDRESEIDGFIPREYWTITAEFQKKNHKFTAALAFVRGEKVDITTASGAGAVVEDLRDAEFTVSDIKTSERRRKAPPPFITSKLQQEAANRLGFNSSRTMIIAQQLYEGVDLKGEGPTGLITYIRTDSTRVSQTALHSVREYIAERFGGEFLPDSPNTFANKKGAQDAHEAIRPTNVLRTPESLKGDISRDQYRLYELVWKRFIASQMKPEIAEVITVNISAKDYLFRASGSIVIFKGFTAVDSAEKTEKSHLPKLEKGEKLDFREAVQEQHFTTPPPRFNDASLVKFLEESGIGRPSTYAPTINTLINRYYVTRSGRQLVPTVLGKLVNDIMVKFFPALVSTDFTANMEELLDKVEDARADWMRMLGDFYGPFKSTVDHAEEHMEEMKGVLDEDTDIVCEKCGMPMKKKLGKYGFFLACSGFPECRNAKALPLGKCPKCGEGDVLKRTTKTRRGGSFYSCSRYPDCDFFTRDIPADKPCPKCGSLLFSKSIKGKGMKLICVSEGCDYQVELLDRGGSTEQNGAASPEAGEQTDEA